MKDTLMPKEAYDYVKKHRRNQNLIGIVIVCLIAGVFVTTMLGEATISVRDVSKIILGKILLRPEWYDGLSKGMTAIVWDIRLPRILTGIIVGAGLGISGAIFQGLLMNPLADPYTIGISTGAALGATVAIFITAILQIANVAILPAAFLGAVITLGIVMKIASKSGNFSSSSLIVAGIIVSSIGSAAISLIKSLAGDEVSIIVFWLMGSLASRTWTHVLLSLPIIVIGGFVSYRYGRELNIISTGDENALTYGVDVPRVRKILLLVAALMTAACVSVSGIIGFVGLVVPHIIRQGITADYKYLLPLSGLCGGLMLLIADNITRIMLAVEIPVGVLTTLIGGPFFIYLFTRPRARGGIQ